jgi:hypothetical protein
MIKNITVRHTSAGFEKPAKVDKSTKRSNGNFLLNLFGFIGEIAVPHPRSR